MNGLTPMAQEVHHHHHVGLLHKFDDRLQTHIVQKKD